MGMPWQSGSVHKVGVPLPLSEEVGLGEVIKRATAALGIPACLPCKRRAEALNRRVVFTGRSPRRTGQ
jgi:hypothetical protein